MNTQIENVKCACKDCVCIISVNSAYKNQEGKIYCSNTCLTGHSNGQTHCDCNTGCACG